MSSWRLLTYEDLPSTQDIALQAAEQGEPGGLAILALRQTRGRGSHGRAWQAPAGNLNLSVLLRPEPAPPGRWALLAGLAVFDAVLPYAGGGALMLKWPNDLVLDGAKLAGVLIETSLGANGNLRSLVIGIGVNLAEAPHIPGRMTACLPIPPAPEALAEHVLHALEARMRQDFAALRADWQARAHPLGTMLDVQAGSRRVQGRFAGLSAGGGLLLEGQAAPIASAEVFLAAAPCC